MSFAGFTLIEVLVSLLLLALMLLGFEAMQIYSLRETRAAFYFAVATNQLTAMVERLRALKEYEGLDKQISIWNSQNQEILPQGLGVVSGIYPSYTITIYWGKQQDECKQMQLGRVGCLSKKINL